LPATTVCIKNGLGLPDGKATAKYQAVGFDYDFMLSQTESMKLKITNAPAPVMGDPLSAEFITCKELLRRIPICRKTLSVYVKAGKIPSVRLGGRKLLFHVPSVTEAILRFQRCDR
jgi:hypothetical protein